LEAVNANQQAQIKALQEIAAKYDTLNAKQDLIIDELE
jgi:hypothetical protein